jgi:hypothetical protein
LSKYKAIKTRVGELLFDSKREARRYGDLKLLERAGQIRNLELQPVFPLIVNGVKVCEYRGDFIYFEGERRVIEDSKGFRTPVYKLKRKLLLALNPNMDHREV